MRTACQAAGVENANGLAAEGKVLTTGGLRESRKYARTTFANRNATAVKSAKKGRKTIIAKGEEQIWIVAGRIKARLASVITPCLPSISR